MSKRIIFTGLLFIQVLNACHHPGRDVKPSRPNIVIILADDFGVGDIQAHYPENKIPTPGLDQLVRQGLSFTDAHSASAVCSPTRYGLLTGRYAWRTPLQEWVLACYEPPLIDAGRLTLPMYLKQNGYHTACFGKWHLGMWWPGEVSERRIENKNGLKNEEWDFSESILEGPTTRGFDTYFGTYVPNFPPFTFIENDRVALQPTAIYRYDPTEGVVMPGGFAGSPMAPGWRFDQILPAITSRAVDYIHEQSRQDAPFFLFFSMTSPHEPVVPSEDFKGRSGIAPIADFVMQTDWSAGQVIKALEDAGVSENTLVIFTADNGHSHYTGWEELIDAGHLPSGPYRGHKGDIWEGGHRVPFIVRWPGKVKPGTSSDRMICLNDIFATCADIIGEDTLPDHSAEDSFSFLGALLQSGDTPSRPDLVSHSVNGEFAYRKGPWKVVFKLPGSLDSSRGEPALAELYNLDEDIAETNDLADQHPEKVRELTRGLKSVVHRGTSRQGPDRRNDVHVLFDTIQTKRWAEEEHHYIPVGTNAWHLEMAGEDRMVIAGYDGTVALKELPSGTGSWSYPAGSFVFDLKTADIDRDGDREIVFVTAQGACTVLDAKGRKEWSFQSDLPLYAVAAGNLDGDASLEIACGGIDRHVYVLSDEGELMAKSPEVERLVHRLAAGNLDADPYDELLVIENRTIANLMAVKGNSLEPVWRKPLQVPDELINWENPRGRFFAFSVDISDLDGDGVNEMIMGDTYFNKQAVMVLDHQANPLWISEGLQPFSYVNGAQLEFYSTAFVRAADVMKDVPGKEVISIAGGMLRIWDKKGDLLGSQNTVPGFTDMEIAGRQIYLGSCPNGDDQIYTIILDGNWQEEFGQLQFRGHIRRVKENIAHLASLVESCEAGSAGDTRYELGIGFNLEEYTSGGLEAYQRRKDWFEAEFPYHNLRLVNRTKAIEETPPLDEQGNPWSLSRWRVDAINGTMKSEEILEKARWIEEHQMPTLFYIGHSCMPFITLETAEKILQAAPEYCIGFQTSEDENLDRIPRYFEHFYQPLADLCLQYGNKICITKNKGLWWMSSPSHDEVFEAMFEGGRRKVAAAATEDSNSRTPEMNLLARGGLWQAGLLRHNEVSIHGDLFSFNRFQQWEYPRSGHAYLRLLVAHTTMGMTMVSTRIRDMIPDGEGYRFSTVGRESTEIFFHMLGKGIVFSPQRENILGYSPIGVVVHQPEHKWLEDAHNGHSPEVWEDDPELHRAVFPHNGNLWGMTNTPEHAFQKVIFHKERQFGYQLPATPYGLVAFVPAQTDLDDVANVRDWWHTDGIYVWKEEGRKYTGRRAAEILRKEFSKAAEDLPFRQVGEPVFMQVIRMEPDRYRIYLIDPGWVDPGQHEVSVRIQMDGEFEAENVLDGQKVTVSKQFFRVKVPAGIFSIVDIIKME